MPIAPLDPCAPAAAELLALSDAYMASLYPAESNHMEGPAALAQPHVRFVGLTIDGEVVGCGAVKIMEGKEPYGEIKRVFVKDQHRGRGFSGQLMADLEHHLREQGIALARLETGIHQPEALALYRKLGYVERPPFGAYLADPLSVFMEKRLF